MPERAPFHHQDHETFAIAVIGDSYSSGTSIGGQHEKNWVDVSHKQLSDNGLRVTITKAAEGGAGYVQVGNQGGTFVSNLARAANEDTDLIVFVGSRNDIRHVTGLSTEVSRAYEDAARMAPEAELLTIGAPWVDGNVPTEIHAINERLGIAAEAAGGNFVDPVENAWFFGQSNLIGADGVHPTDEGHAYMAAMITPHIQAALRG
ncbi:SGNH/GDSL hydrolase family protein [Arthrobacter crystallopoietes]|uniref:SGNH/GDSL hydrolase family protein n=1 Tax=Crystallibacter crystallopoietes TaxID=37928 RepID=UPI001ABEC3E7|nr:SGNH/GDSL hydrolase family protein [Arthrobacter crystallopoietes]QTG79520.1 SGNH/GDSL hydrolase family protein [Arthrobacter crystallopoietes]